MINENEKLAGLTLIYNEFAKSYEDFRKRYETLDDFLGFTLEPRHHVVMYFEEKTVVGALLYTVAGHAGMFHFFAVDSTLGKSGGLIFKILARYVVRKYSCPFTVRVPARNELMRDYHSRLGATLDINGHYRYTAEVLA